MNTDIYWIDGGWSGHLAILPRPRGGDWLEDEVRSWQLTGVDVVVSLLTAEEIADLDLAQEAELSQRNGVRFLSFPIADRGVPASRRATIELVRILDKALAEGKNLAIHCRQGIGRSALLAACLLIMTGVDPDTAFQRLSAARGCAVPETAEQREWVRKFAQELPAPVPQQ